MSNTVKITRVEKIAEEVIRTCFGAVPFISYRLQAGERVGQSIFDFLLEVTYGNQTKTIVCEVKAKGEPKFTRIAVNQLLQYLDMFPNSYGLFIAPYISEAAAKICQQAGIGYLDFSGNCYISFDTVLINRQGYPNKDPERRDLRTLFSPKAERILRVLLENGPRKWKTQEIADEAGISLGLVSKVKQLLEEREWIDSQTVGFELIEPFELLDEWKRNYKSDRNQIKQFYSLSNGPELEALISEVCGDEGIQCAFTGFSAAAEIAPMVRYQKVTAYIADESLIDLLASRLQLNRVSSGANLWLYKPYDEGVFYNSSIENGKMIVSAVQNYLDLSAEKGRGEEAAEAILREVLQKRWQ